MFNKLFSVILVSIFATSCQTYLSSFSNSGVEFKVRIQSKDKTTYDLANQAIDVFKNRFNQFGVKNKTEFLIDSKNTNELNVKVFGKPDVELVKKILLYESNLALMAVISPPNPNLATYPTKEKALETIGGKETSTKKVFEYTEQIVEESKTNTSEQKFIVVENPPIITGKAIRDASATSFSGNDTDYQISFSLKPDAAKTFGDWTGKNIGNYIAVILNNEAKSVAFIQSQIFDQGQISGRFKKQEAEDLARILKSGYLPAKIELLEEKEFGKAE